jgi:adenylosuccinate synthase
LGRENNYWTKEVLQSIKKCDNDTNIEFIQSKIDRLKNNISDLIDTINECTIILPVHRKHDFDNQTAQRIFQTTGIHITGPASSDNNIRVCLIQFDNYLHEFNKLM